MKLLTLSVEGFGPFKDAQEIDFTEFDDSGIFLIGGRTGAGKSTILDAICFALYGSVPRYDDFSGVAKLRSDHCTPDDPTRVALTFDSGAAQYRLTRTPEYERPKLRGEGLAKQPASVLLEQRTEAGWEGLETKSAEVGRMVAEIVQLNKKEFLQVALLAQNRFQEFLEADSNDRQELLRRLFDTERFFRYTESLATRARELEEEVRSASDTVARMVTALSTELGAPVPEPGAALLDWAKDLTASVTAAAGQAQRAEQDHERHARATETAVTAARELDHRQGRRRDAAARLADLDRRAAEVEELRKRLRIAARASELHAYAAAEKESRRRLHDADEEQRQAIAAAGTVPDGDLEENVAQIAEMIGALTTAAQTETTLPRLSRSVETARAGLTRLRQQAAEAAQRRQQEIERCQRAEIDALAALSTATSAERALREAHLRGRAAILAEQLTPGEPCPVCGAAEHPAPAHFTDDPVTDDDLERAEHQRRAAQQAVDDARHHRAQAQTRAAEGGSETEHLQDAMTAVTVAENALLEAQTRVQGSLAGHASIADRISELTGRRGALERLTAARRERARAAADHASDESRLRHELQARGFPDRAAAVAVALPKQERDRIDTEINRHDAARNQVLGVLALPELEELPEQRPDLESLSAAAMVAAAAHRSATEQRVTTADRARRSRELTSAIERELAGTAESRRELDLVNGLARAAKGDPGYNGPGIPLERFVLAAELEEIVAAANERLRTMSQGRYMIEHSDERTRGGKRTGLELVIYDAHTGSPRVPQSLSGGEKFLASLALALGMAEVVTARAGGITLDTLFIDEGFGSLDAETLEIAMQTLDQLRQGGRTVGLISHVDAMQEQIPAKLEVTVGSDGTSRVTTSV